MYEGMSLEEANYTVATSLSAWDQWVAEKRDYVLEEEHLFEELDHLYEATGEVLEGLKMWKRSSGVPPVIPLTAHQLKIILDCAMCGMATVLRSALQSQIDAGKFDDNKKGSDQT